MAELIAIGYPEEATAQQGRDEVSWLTKRPDTARANIRTGEGTIGVATNPYRLAVGIIWGMVLGLLVDLAAGTGARVPVRPAPMDLDRRGWPVETCETEPHPKRVMSASRSGGTIPSTVISVCRRGRPQEPMGVRPTPAAAAAA